MLLVTDPPVLANPTDVVRGGAPQPAPSRLRLLRITAEPLLAVAFLLPTDLLVVGALQAVVHGLPEPVRRDRPLASPEVFPPSLVRVAGASPMCLLAAIPPLRLPLVPAWTRPRVVPRPLLAVLLPALALVLQARRLLLDELLGRGQVRPLLRVALGVLVRLPLPLLGMFLALDRRAVLGALLQGRHGQPRVLHDGASRELAPHALADLAQHATGALALFAALVLLLLLGPRLYLNLEKVRAWEECAPSYYRIESRCSHNYRSHLCCSCSWRRTCRPSSANLCLSSSLRGSGPYLLWASYCCRGWCSGRSTCGHCHYCPSRRNASGSLSLRTVAQTGKRARHASFSSTSYSS